MSERRLPVLGAPVDATPTYAPLPPGARAEPGLPVVSIVAARPELSEHADRFAHELLDALAQRGARACALRAEISNAGRSVTLGVPTAAQRPAARVAAPASELAACVREGLAGLGELDAMVSLGAAFPALFRPRLVVLLTDGLASPGWSPEVRAVRDRVDLELSDPRPGVARGLAELVLRP